MSDMEDNPEAALNHGSFGRGAHRSRNLAIDNLIRSFGLGSDEGNMAREDGEGNPDVRAGGEGREEASGGDEGREDASGVDKSGENAEGEIESNFNQRADGEISENAQDNACSVNAQVGGGRGRGEVRRGRGGGEMSFVPIFNGACRGDRQGEDLCRGHGAIASGRTDHRFSGTAFRGRGEGRIVTILRPRGDFQGQFGRGRGGGRGSGQVRRPVRRGSSGNRGGRGENTPGNHDYNAILGEFGLFCITSPVPRFPPAGRDPE